MLPPLQLGGTSATIAPGLMVESGTGPGGGSTMSQDVCQRLPEATAVPPILVPYALGWRAAGALIGQYAAFAGMLSKTSSSSR